jgi:hypothetical protein
MSSACLVGVGALLGVLGAEQNPLEMEVLERRHAEKLQTPGGVPPSRFVSFDGHDRNASHSNLIYSLFCLEASLVLE